MNEPTTEQLRAELLRAQAIVTAVAQQRDAAMNEAALLKADLALIQARAQAQQAEQAPAE